MKTGSKRSKLLTPLSLLQAPSWMMPPELGRKSALLSVQIQMLISLKRHPRRHTQKHCLIQALYSPVRKRPWCWERLRAGEKGGNRGWDGRMASLIQWTWIWANSRRWWGTERPSVLQSVGSQRVGQDLATEQQQKWQHGCHGVVQQKQTQHCKAIILQLKIIWKKHMYNWNTFLYTWD